MEEEIEESGRKSFGEAFSEYLEARGAADGEIARDGNPIVVDGMADEGVMPAASNATAKGQLFEVFASKTEAEAVALASSKPGAMCFTTDTQRIVFNGVAYGVTGGGSAVEIRTDVKEVQAAAMSRFFPGMVLMPDDSPRIWCNGTVRGTGTSASATAVADLTEFRKRNTGASDMHHNKTVELTGYDQTFTFPNDMGDGGECAVSFEGNPLPSTRAKVSPESSVNGPKWADKGAYCAFLFTTQRQDLEVNVGGFFGPNFPGASMNNLTFAVAGSGVNYSTSTHGLTINSGYSALVVFVGSGDGGKGYCLVTGIKET